ncbi:MAG TPA: hypothetical protein IAA29_14585 [Candidatus Paenibacillus intestinavium]|nr:hypothetical protein [Candidatus Paenibacillus intestinavium]
MSAVPQPARKSYFFGKGYRDLRNTIQGAWNRNTNSINQYKANISKAKEKDMFIKVFLFFLNVLAMLAVYICGFMITFFISTINVVILLTIMSIIYIGFSIIWLIDRIYLVSNKIFTACHECKERTLIPTYICPGCGAKHSNLIPGSYGIWKRKCNCGTKLPTSVLNGRRKLMAECSACTHTLLDRETVPICIPVVGGRSVGKTAFINAFSRDFIEKIAPEKGWDIELYNEEKSDIYQKIKLDYSTGNTRMTERIHNVNKASSVSFSFFVKGAKFRPERLVHIYDIAGEVFTDNNENEVQKQYEYCQGIVLIIDPFSIPAVRSKYEVLLEPEDIAGIGRADINGVINSFLNKLREVTGLSESKISTVPLAIVINKIDSAGLVVDIGDVAVNKAMAADPEKFRNYADTQDYLCRMFLKQQGMESFLNNVSIKFENNRFFACSAIGHARSKGEYLPKGVMAPMEWLFRNADNKMAKEWKDTAFNRKPLATDNIED